MYNFHNLYTNHYVSSGLRLIEACIGIFSSATYLSTLPFDTIQLSIDLPMSCHRHGTALKYKSGMKKLFYNQGILASDEELAESEDLMR